MPHGYNFKVSFKYYQLKSPKYHSLNNVWVHDSQYNPCEAKSLSICGPVKIIKNELCDPKT